MKMIHNNFKLGNAIVGRMKKFQLTFSRKFWTWTHLVLFTAFYPLKRKAPLILIRILHRVGNELFSLIIKSPIAIFLYLNKKVVRNDAHADPLQLLD